MKTLTTATVDSPVGSITVLADGEALVGLEFTDRAKRLSALHEHLAAALGKFDVGPAPDPAGAVSRLERYFAGDMGALVEQNVAMHGTDFEKKVWRALCEIAAGETHSYKEIAAAVGSPRAVRAVGAANGHTPVALFVPCHRVVASDGSLHGYGGGLDKKRWLLDHERAHASPTSAARGKQLHFSL